jgi:1-acyl-sn-glycerol-3-phosphate acyltransferase
MKKEMRRLCQQVVVRPLMLGMLGLRVSNRERLPRSGPAIVVANHNSHLDTAALFTLFPLSLLPSLHAVAASDYFFCSSSLAGWIARSVFGAIPLERSFRAGHGDPLAACSAALASGAILFFFPEGTRGEPGCLSEFKLGLAHLVRRHPNIPVIPVGLIGLDRVLPKGARVPLPLTCEARVGSPQRWTGDCRSFTAGLKAALASLIGWREEPDEDAARGYAMFRRAA